MANLADYGMDRSRLLLPGLLFMLAVCINPLGNQISCDKIDSDLQSTQWPPSAQIQQEQCSTGFNPSYQSTLTDLTDKTCRFYQP